MSRFFNLGLVLHLTVAIAPTPPRVAVLFFFLFFVRCVLLSVCLFSSQLYAGSFEELDWTLIPVYKLEVVCVRAQECARVCVRCLSPSLSLSSP